MAYWDVRDDYWMNECEIKRKILYIAILLMRVNYILNLQDWEMIVVIGE
ncbi:MAG: hypothetical protein ACD_71C00170G0002 [uncultured bacterium (gcode 4)]|uniref:Uncharacterized protein n=1 Tax=uncultured bacterium (gcode 4) TaxID=1234023 RepID=K1ZIT8_9BACT|nr:MAG: hypothetical protein ACD_71C00170G0002 [uncultured bacterium (gcode 4)]